MSKAQQMDDDRLNAFISYELQQCIGYAGHSNNITAERKKALAYYLNLPRGDEEEGRSQLQSSDVNDNVEAFLPGLLAPFISNDDVVQFTRLTSDADTKEEARAVNYSIMNDNNGEIILYVFAKDGLLQKNGFLYVDWSEKKCVRIRKQRLNFMQMQQLSQNKDISIIKAMVIVDGKPVEQKEIHPEMLMSSMFEVQYREVKTEGRIKIANIPPEYMFVHKDANGMDDPRMIGWIERVTISDLRAEGVEDDKLEQLKNTNSDYSDIDGERRIRTDKQSGTIDTANNDAVDNDESSRRVWRSVLFTHVDYDGDGYAEYRKIIRAGNGRDAQNVILFNEEIDICPIVTWTPIIMPHQYFGRSLADLIFDIQDMKTALLRNMMNAVYDIEPSFLIDMNKTADSTIDDYYNRAPRSLIEVGDVTAFSPLNENTPDIANAFQIMQYADAMRETRTPVTRQMQAVDPDLLQDKTATEANIQHNASAQRQELIIRLFGFAVRELCYKVYQLLIKNQSEPRLLRLNENEPPVQVNPAYWDADMDVSVKVGLGTGSKQQQLQSVMMILNAQLQNLQLQLGNVTPDKLSATYSQLVAASGLGNADIYFNDMGKDKDQAAEQQTKAAQAKAFEEGRQAGGQEAAQQLDAEGKQMQAQQMQQDAAQKQAELAFKQKQHDDNVQLKLAELQAKHDLEDKKLQVEGARIMAEASIAHQDREDAKDAKGETSESAEA